MSTTLRPDCLPNLCNPIVTDALMILPGIGGLP